MISLEKNQGLSLSKAAPSLLVARFGLGWSNKTEKKKGFFAKLFGDESSRERDIDLDASAVCYDGRNRIVSRVYFGHLHDRGIDHSGDDRRGGGAADADNEIITVHLDKLPPNVMTVVLTVNSYQGDTFASIKDAFVRLVNGETSEEVARYTLSDIGNHTGLIMCKLVFENGDWVLTALGVKVNGRTVHSIEEAIQTIL